MESIIIHDNKHGIYKCMETNNADSPFSFELFLSKFFTLLKYN